MKSCSTFPCEELAHRQCEEPAGTLTVWGMPGAFMMDNLLLAFRFPFILKGVTSALILKKTGYFLLQSTCTYFECFVNADNTISS